MRVTIEEQQFSAPTAAGLIEQIKGMHWHTGETATAEEYIAQQEKAYKAVTGRRMKLPDGDTETRAIAMFKAIAKTGGWDFTESE